MYTEGLRAHSQMEDRGAVESDRLELLGRSILLRCHLLLVGGETLAVEVGSVPRVVTDRDELRRRVGEDLLEHRDRRDLLDTSGRRIVHDAITEHRESRGPEKLGIPQRESIPGNFSPSGVLDAHFPVVDAVVVVPLESTTHDERIAVEVGVEALNLFRREPHFDTREQELRPRREFTSR